ncbi:glycosyltransferase [Sedimentitalea sp. JM2-8]|uniref:Glycosyltransferase n=2 Tax=Sedimentitalea xiamensis TaxID=3050037 RepID=A0ABT7FHG7_9RHOB|nr:glycosyltransferase [Sedimentitalea xiamensis]
MSRLSYSAVIATRNRPEALALSLPLILGQSRAPAQMIVVDSSPDTEANRAIITSAEAAFGRTVTYIISPPSSSVQRNIGLAEVTEPVVLFPDDDSLLHPGVMEEIMATYERDEGGLIGGVCAAEADTAPEGALASARYEMTLGDRIRKPVAATRFRLERALVPEPFLRAGRRLARNHPRPDWIDGERHVEVEFMTGFRMSFRTELIRRHGFDETLGRYALFEDTDASFKILKSHLLVGARRAQIYHYKAPAKRDGGFSMGAMQILNRAYVLAQDAERDAAMRRQLRRFSRYKIAQYGAAATSGAQFAKDRLRGARAAMNHVDVLMGCPSDAVSGTYLAARRALGLDP